MTSSCQKIKPFRLETVSANQFKLGEERLRMKIKSEREGCHARLGEQCAATEYSVNSRGVQVCWREGHACISGRGTGGIGGAQLREILHAGMEFGLNVVHKRGPVKICKLKN